MKSLNKIILGTAQFAKKYGITNQAKKLSKKEIFKILRLCKSNKIQILDYATSYYSLGYLNFKKIKFKFIVKVKSIFFLKQSEKTIINKIDKIRNALSQSNLDYLLIHDNKITFNKKDNLFVKNIELLKKNKKIKYFGFSIYEEKELLKLKKYFNIIDVLQVPINIFDQRFVKSKYLKLYKKYKIKLHARSIFLQGSLIGEHKNNKLEKYLFYFEEFKNFCKKNKITKIDACIKFILSQKCIDKIIIGIDSRKQFNNLIMSFKRNNNNAGNNLKFKNFNAPKNLIDPRKW